MVNVYCLSCYFFFFFKQKTAYEMRISDWSSDVCSSDLPGIEGVDFGLQPVDLDLVDAQRPAAALLVLRGRKIGAEVEQVVLDARQHGVEVGAGGMQPGQADGGIGLVDGAIGLAPQVRLGPTPALPQRGNALEIGRAAWGA